MKLYSVDVWCEWDSESGSNELIVAENKEIAEEKALSSHYYDSAEAKEVTEIDGYKITLELK